jgi:hexosaminidase
MHLKLPAFLSTTALALCLSPALAATTGLPALMPLPSSAATGTGDFPLTASFTLTYATPPDQRLTDAVTRALARLQFASGVPLAHAAVAPSSGALTITVGSDPAVQSVNEDESYHLAVYPQGIQLKSATVVGAIHALETLLQLTTFRDGQPVIAGATIDDQPRFRWRGLMIDVSRHFEPVEVIKRNLDGMALVKLNVFHWHLSDDQGFRAESKRFPKLTELATDGEFYTQDEMRDVVAYARARGIRVVPEFDMPGHTLSWQVAYPDLASSPGPFALPQTFNIHDEALDPTRESTFKFLDGLVGEMAAIFPDAYFHIGGDESNGNAWRGNPKIVAFMKSHNIANTDALQVYFNAQLLKIVARHGKTMIGWDEVFTPGLPKDIVIESWRGEESLAAAATQGYQGILAAPYYLDGQATAEKHFLADPIPAETTLTPDQQKLILGGEIAMWAEQINALTIDSRIWPRAAAIAERFWSPQSDRDVVGMYTRLWPVSLQLETAGLTHISGPQKMLRNLAQSQQPAELATLASVLEPVSFSDRYDLQKTDRTTPLDRLVDAVVADPPSRFEFRQLVEAATSSAGDAAAPRQILRERFQSWVDAGPALSRLVAVSPRLSDAGLRVEQLVQLGQAGLQALDALDGKAAPATGWKAQQTARIAAAAEPVAITHFTFLPSLQKLIDAAGAK